MLNVLPPAMPPAMPSSTTSDRPTRHGHRMNRLGVALAQFMPLAVAMAVAGLPFWFQTAGF
ncbi:MULTISPECIES: hypothetical protein [unclassified Cupriavidus]|uniref:hypothetical protein n=1 Tax=unclassified Cupriavidus TaxID=2640874 RepID=UPI0010F811D4|nr:MULTISPECIES: hypothetical protein [unclassified Cupriavidus]MWL89872.1 hypothetical protein [Cupriavidus sp. SW-Y-13]